jgi:two-component system phosphate regulon sensor histidine kinase PhoR
MSGAPGSGVHPAFQVSTSQLKLMSAVAVLVLLVTVVSGALAQRALRERELARLATSLEERAALVRELTRGRAFDPADAAALDALADRAGAAARARVTLIAPDGTVVGDSDVPLERLAAVESHADRPEVREALQGAVGQSRRRSETVGRSLLYLAVPLREGHGGIVRIALDTAHLDRALADLRSRLAAAGTVGVVAALALAYGISWFAFRPLREIQRLTEAVAGGDLDYRLPRRFRDEFGGIADSIRLLTDQLRERLAEATGEKERLQAVLNAMVEAVLVVRHDRQIVLANDRLLEFYGIEGDVRGLTPLEATRHEELDDVLDEARRSGEPVGRAIAIRHPLHRAVRVQAAPFPAAPAARRGTVAVLHDVTDLARVEQMRRDFVANASHELRTPLAAIRGFAETLLGSNGLSDAERRNYLEVIDRHALRLGNLVGDLLELSRIEGGEALAELERVDVADVAATLLRDDQPRYRRKEVTVTHEASGASLALADPQALEQILTNLLDNAVKYTEPGGRIDVQVGGDERWVRVRVSDTGCGIPEDDLGRIFERFYRVDKARSRELGGTGLGLSIVKHLVQSMGGEIAVESELGKGSTFAFSLPRA